MSGRRHSRTLAVRSRKLHSKVDAGTFEAVHAHATAEGITLSTAVHRILRAWAAANAAAGGGRGNPD